jgi:hypothetical protein
LLLAALLLAGSAYAQPVPAPAQPETKPPPPPPRLTGLKGICAPGKTARLSGRRLGATGRVVVMGLKTAVSMPAQRIPGGVSVRFPASITGELDGMISLVYLRGGSRRSNSVRCAFRARRETQVLRLSRFTRAECATPGPPGTDENTAMAKYAGCRHAHPGSEGVDRWQIAPLVNGWQIDQVVFDDLSAGGTVTAPKLPLDDAKSLAFEIPWSAAGGTADYRFTTRLIGPVGTSPYVPRGRKAARRLR